MTELGFIFSSPSFADPAASAQSSAHIWAQTPIALFTNTDGPPGKLYCLDRQPETMASCYNSGFSSFKRAALWILERGEGN